MTIAVIATIIAIPLVGALITKTEEENDDENKGN